LTSGRARRDEWRGCEWRRLRSEQEQRSALGSNIPLNSLDIIPHRLSYLAVHDVVPVISQTLVLPRPPARLLLGSVSVQRRRQRKRKRLSGVERNQVRVDLRQQQPGSTRNAEAGQAGVWQLTSRTRSISYVEDLAPIRDTAQQSHAISTDSTKHLHRAMRRVDCSPRSNFLPSRSTVSSVKASEKRIDEDEDAMLDKSSVVLNE
jgi:hypothetical protein